MTRRQTGPGIAESYGLGWGVGDGWFGHGGAHATNMAIDMKRGLVRVYLVQHAGFRGDGAKGIGAFEKTVEARFGI
jgi:CubicO group peptidase (beta-lactamase class C family)